MKALETGRKKVEERIRVQSELSINILDHLPYPFYVVDAKDYTIKMTNSTALGGTTSKDLTCYALSHNTSQPCRDPAHPCPLEQGKKTGKARVVEHVHFDKNGNVTNVEVHAHPVFDNNGNVIQVIEYCLDITNRKKLENEIKASLKQKEVLLKEIHHRVKNNLQVVSSLLNFQSEHIKDKEAIEAFNKSQDRIRVMGLLHEKLCRSEDLGRVDIAEYIRDLVSYLFRSYQINPDIIILKTHVDDIFLSIDVTIPCGLIVNELVSNCLKHVFPQGRKGTIGIDLWSDEKSNLALIVRDNGVGIPKHINFQKTESLGLQLVNMLVYQLRGSIELGRSGGTAFKITFAGQP